MPTGKTTLEIEKYKGSSSNSVFIEDSSGNGTVKLTYPTEYELKALLKYAKGYKEEEGKVTFWIEVENASYSKTWKAENSSIYQAVKDYLDSAMSRELHSTDSDWYKDQPESGLKTLSYATVLSLINELVEPYGVCISEVWASKEAKLPAGWKKALGKKYHTMAPDFEPAFPMLLIGDNDGQLKGFTFHPRAKQSGSWSLALRIDKASNVQYVASPPGLSGQAAEYGKEINFRNCIAYGTTKFSEAITDMWKVSTPAYGGGSSSLPTKANSLSEPMVFNPLTRTWESAPPTGGDQDHDPFGTNRAAKDTGGGRGPVVTYSNDHGEFRAFLFETFSIYPGELLPRRQFWSRVYFVQDIVEELRQMFAGRNIDRMRKACGGSITRLADDEAYFLFKRVDTVAKKYGSELTLAELYDIARGIIRDKKYSSTTEYWLVESVIGRFVDNFDYITMMTQKENNELEEAGKEADEIRREIARSVDLKG